MRFDRYEFGSIHLDGVTAELGECLTQLLLLLRTRAFVVDVELAPVDSLQCQEKSAHATDII